MFKKVIVANRGAVAVRVLRALNEMGIQSVALYSEADAGAPYLAMASETYAIGPAPARESYLNQDLILDVVRKSHACLGISGGVRSCLLPRSSLSTGSPATPTARQPRLSPFACSRLRDTPELSPRHVGPA